MVNSLDQETDKQRFIFISASILLISLVVWWITLQVSQTQEMTRIRIEKLRSIRAEAWLYDSTKVLKYYENTGVIKLKVPENIEITSKLPSELPSRKERERDILLKFPDVKIVPIPTAIDDPPLLDMPDAYLTLDVSKLASIESERKSMIWRAILQIGILAIGIMTGLILIFNKLNKEIDLKLRQQNFLDSVTHELKTPIASIQIWTETIFSKAINKDQMQMISERIHQDIDRLSSLVNNLLIVAKGESLHLSSNREVINLSEMLETNIEIMCQKIGPNSLGSIKRIEKEIYIRIDPEQFRIIIDNLLSNAYKYSDSPRTTEIQLKSDQKFAIITIKDQGYGIDIASLERIFDKFYRSGSEMTRRVPGTGIGLFLVKQLTELNGGTVTVKSEGLNQGSVFTVSFPLENI